MRRGKWRGNIIYNIQFVRRVPKGNGRSYKGSPIDNGGSPIDNRGTDEECQEKKIEVRTKEPL